MIWFLLSFIFHRQIIFSFAGAKPITREEIPHVYNIVENLCISRGVPIPKIGIIEDLSYNAFATGRGNKARIVFSRGITEKLSKQELEAVAAHELSHIINKDTLLMVVVVVFIGVVGTLGEFLIRGASSIKSDSKDSG